jgi:hypothetical protein
MQGNRRAMMRRLIAVLIWCVLASLQGHISFAHAGDGVTVWTAIIPDAFPRFVYTWRMKDDGSYREDGREVANGKPIQPTFAGHWSREGSRMLLKQDDQPFVFDGVVLGGLYTGTLYFRRRVYSRFCAAKGEAAPERCDTSPGVAMLVEQPVPSQPAPSRTLRSIPCGSFTVETAISEIADSTAM